MSRIMARRRQASAVRARFSTSLASQPAAPVPPAEGALDAPPLRQRFAPGPAVGARADLQLPAADGAHGRGGGRALIAAVGEDPLDERQRAARLVEHGQAPVAIPHVGGMDARAQQQTERVDQDMPLAPLDLLGRVGARRVGARSPFSAPLTLWLSRIAALGLASRPACSRAWT
jgi:hypothetical protein